MKKLLLIAFTALSTVFAHAQDYGTYQSIDAFPTLTAPTYQLSTLKDGYYEASVRYTNYKTGTIANYTLNVKVESDRVTEIDFPKGGYVHTGFNNEGYLYTGGYLEFEKDYEGNITSATTTVTNSDDNGERTFEITIQ